MTGRAAERQYWQTLEELAAQPEMAAKLAAVPDGVPRRRLLQLMAASLALGGLSGCGRETNSRVLLPYVEAPPGIVPGQSRSYATAVTEGGYATGVLLTHQMGRPVKVEGNPDHPASRGAASAIHQASILTLYDPHRAQSLSHKGQLTSWEVFVAAITDRRPGWLAGGGDGIRLLTGNVTSPTLIAQIAAVRQQFPGLRWHRWEALDRDEELQAATSAFGRPLDCVFDLSAADVIFAVESDVISRRPGHLAYASDFAARRRLAKGEARMSRIYAIESTPTLLGAKADHRLALPPAEIGRALRLLAGLLGAGPAEWRQIETPHADWLKTAAQDLAASHGRSLVTLGPEQPAELHLIGHSINDALGSFGATIKTIEPVAPDPVPARQTLAGLVDDMQAGKVDTLIIAGVNPVYAAPGDIDFAAALARVPHAIALTLYQDETAQACEWHLPLAHEYEAWADARAFDGTATVQQPQLRPLYGGRSLHQVLSLMLGDTQPDDLALVRAHWQTAADQGDAAGFDEFWQESLRRGVIAAAAAPVSASLKPDLLAALNPPAAAASGITLLFRGDDAVGDGGNADNAWLLELPRPLTRLTWDNAALIAPATAARLGVRTEDSIEITADGRSLVAPVFVLPGQAPDCITLPLGFGRRAGGLAVGVGFDTAGLRRNTAPFLREAATVAKTSRAYRLASVQGHDRMAGRDLIHAGNLKQYLDNPDFLRHPEPHDSLYAEVPYPGAAWAMAIDLNSCIGCQACVAACQAENNIPIVGKEQVLAGREMHWLRVDRYYSGPADTPSIAFQPVPCMHCEKAPCEVACPVEATVHDHQGLNAMVYNRCVGTRFCSNNCPYKVRRFNFFAYAMQQDRPDESWNPEVTVRDRGVMEKCTYCVQRIRQAQIAADRDDRPLRDGDIVTACQQSCPTQAIVFGDRNDVASAVARRKASPLDYVLLAELNTRPRTSYQALIHNPNPALPDTAG